MSPAVGWALAIAAGIGAAWLTVAIPAGVLIGRAIALADRRSHLTAVPTWSDQ